MKKLRVAQMGLGPIGNRMTACMLAKGGFEIVAAADVDPEKKGLDVAELAGLEPIGVEVREDLGDTDSSTADLVVLTTLSRLASLTPQIEDCMARGLNVVTTCEELAYPWRRQPELARRIDRQAQSRGVSVLSTGVNPGFMMDYLPLVASGVCQSVDSVLVERVQDAGARRLPFQQKIGAGLSEEEFRRRVEDGDLGHVGLPESIDMIAAGLGWDLDSVEETVDPVLVDDEELCREWNVKRGQARGLHQVGVGRCGDKEAIRLVFRATLGEPESYDRVRLASLPPVDLRIEGGVHGDVATVSIALNCAPAVAASTPGLKTMLDLPATPCFAPGVGRWCSGS